MLRMPEERVGWTHMVHSGDPYREQWEVFICHALLVWQQWCCSSSSKITSVHTYRCAQSQAANRHVDRTGPETAQKLPDIVTAHNWAAGLRSALSTQCTAFCYICVSLAFENWIKWFHWHKNYFAIKLCSFQSWCDSTKKYFIILKYASYYPQINTSQLELILVFPSKRMIGHRSRCDLCM